MSTDTLRTLTHLALAADGREDPPSDEVAREALRCLPGSPAAERRSLVLVLLGTDLPDARAALGELLVYDLDPEVRALCLSSAAVDPAFPLDPLLMAARGPRPELRASALEVLAGRPEPLAREAIVELLRDAHPAVASRARAIVGDEVEPPPVPEGLLERVRAEGGWLPWARDRTFRPLVDRGEDLLRTFRRSAEAIAERYWTTAEASLGSWSSGDAPGDPVEAKVYWAGEPPAGLRTPKGKTRRKVDLHVSEPSLVDGSPAGTLHVAKAEVAEALLQTWVWIYVPGEGGRHELEPFRVLGEIHEKGDALRIPFGGSDAEEPERYPLHATELEVAFFHHDWVDRDGSPQ